MCRRWDSDHRRIALADRSAILHDALDLPTPPNGRPRVGISLVGAGWHDLVLAYGWEWRTAAEGIAEVAVAVADAALADEPYDLAAAHRRGCARRWRPIARRVIAR